MWILTHHKSLIKAICVASVGLLSLFAVKLYKQNQKLSERAEIAETNVLAYQGLLNDSQQANNVLRLDVKDLKSSNDSLLNELDNVRKQLNINKKALKLAATKSQSINVIDGKKTDGQVIVKDSIYRDSICYNDLTKVYYTIGTDTVSIELDLKNTEYFYIYKDKHYKNKKKFFKRLFTGDWKKVTEIKYDIKNTNDLFDCQDVRVVEITK